MTYLGLCTKSTEIDINKYTVDKNVTHDCSYDESSQWKRFSDICE